MTSYHLVLNGDSEGKYSVPGRKSTDELARIVESRFNGQAD
ncbi:MAG: hypothetical protein ABIE22_00305 [archaeon]